ncbi:hypothetical protein VE03_10430, partial [Pseudogymnoascus sp. 23342-1-I1]
MALASQQQVPEQRGSTDEQAQFDPQEEAEETGEEEGEEEETDSALGLDDTGSSTTSLASSMRRYRHENGRTYHSFRNGVYPMPNDEREQARLDTDFDTRSTTPLVSRETGWWNA